MRKSYEDLLFEYGVDIVLAGHVHACMYKQQDILKLESLSISLQCVRGCHLGRHRAVHSGLIVHGFCFVFVSPIHMM